MAGNTFDICVVGSGPGGGIATYALAQAGLKVALIEAGPRLRAGVDYNAHGSPYRNLEPRLKAGYRQPISSVFADRCERNHFTPVGDNPGHGLLKALGGRSLCWAGHSLRFGPVDFQRWPISYEEVAPYYSRAERFMGVYGHKDGLYNLPDGEFLKAVPMRCPEQLLHRGINRMKARGRRIEFVKQRKAILTQPHWSARALCHYCGHCMNGCEVDAKYTSANTPIPLALKTGNLSMFLETTMTGIRVDAARGRVAGIEYVTGESAGGTLDCKVLVLACSAIETARHLLLNRTRQFPNGLANGSGQVGRNLTSHFGLDVIGLFPELRGRDASNDDGTDYFHSLVTGLYWDKPHPHFDGTYQVQCGAGVHPSGLMIRDVPGYGANFKSELRQKNVCHVLMNMQGALFVSPNKYVDLDPDRKDRFGLSLPRVHLHYDRNDIAMAQDMVETCEEIVRQSGGEVYRSPGKVKAEKLAIDYNHWVGTAKMGTDPKTSVVNVHSQSHEIPNLFIGDASVFAAYPEKNPTLTNIALSWRMSDHLVEKFRSGEI